MAKGYFDLREFDRCAFFTKDAKSPRVVFLHYYSRYMSGEKKRLDNATDFITNNDSAQLKYLRDLRQELQKLHEKQVSHVVCSKMNFPMRKYHFQLLDGYCLYLYGIVLKRLNLNDDARDVLVEATRAEPCHWGAWLELSGHISERGELAALRLPDHWMKHFFLAHTYLELQLNEAALETYFGLQMGGGPGQGLHDSTYILAQVAIGEYSSHSRGTKSSAKKEVRLRGPLTNFHQDAGGQQCP